MFLADDDLFEFYNEKDESNYKKVIPKVMFKRTICHFFIPNVSPKSFENENNSDLKRIIKKEEEFRVKTDLPPEASEFHSAFKPQFLRKLSNSNDLNLLPQLETNEKSQFKEKCQYTNRDALIKESFYVSAESPKNVEDLSKKLGSKIKDYSKRNISCEFQRSRLNSSPSHETVSSSSCSLFTVNSSIAKRDCETCMSHNQLESGDELLTNSPSEICSSSSFINALNVDIDNETSKEKKKLKHMQPVVVLERLRVNKSHKRKVDTKFEHISSTHCYNTDEKIRYNEEMYKKVNRVIESDEETVYATDDTFAEISPRIYHFTEKKSNTQGPVLVEDDPLHCFKCNLDFKTFCDKHPVNKILNMNIKCPFLEYMTDSTYDKYLHSSLVRSCCCKQNELDHIQQSLPESLQLRESNISEIGIWSTCKIIRGTIIGPYLGEIVESCNTEQLKTNLYKTRHALKKSYFYSRIESAFKSNWLRCINFTNDQNESNLQILHRDQKVFFQTTKDIESDQELFVLNKGQH